MLHEMKTSEHEVSAADKPLSGDLLDAGNQLVEHLNRADVGEQSERNQYVGIRLGCRGETVCRIAVAEVHDHLQNRLDQIRDGIAD